MKRLRKTVLIGGSTTLGAVMVMAALLWPRDFGPLDPPSPNGYDDFLSAAYALRGEAVDYASEAVLQALVSTNQEAYGLVSTGLTKRCVVPIQIARGYPAAHTADLARLKRLAHCLVARAELERRQGRVAEAGESYCAAYAFASRIGQGGLAVDFLVRISCEAIVLHHFRSIVSDLTAEQCSAMLRVMEQAEKDAEDWRAATERQLRWDRSVFSPRERLAHFRLRVAAAIRERSWRSLRGLGAELRPVEVRHRNQEVLPVISLLRGAAAQPANFRSNTTESHPGFLLETLDRTLSAGGYWAWAASAGPAWEAPPDRQKTGQFWRYHWYERGLTNGNPVYESRFRVNAPEASLHPTFGRRVEARENGLMQIRAEEDLFRITAAEFYAEVWGGHPGTANKRITVNGRSTYLLPRVGTEEGHCTYFYPSIPLKLSDLVNGYEAVQWAVDQGTTFWGHTLVDNAAIRVALTNGHPDLEKLGLASFSGRVTAEPLPSGEGFKLELECPAEVAVRIASVDFQGWYEGYDENGNRQRRDWHGYSKHRLPVATLGVVPAAPFALTWDTRMLPAQHDVAVRAAVRFRADTNLVFLTAATPGLAIAPRSDAEVTWIAPQDLPDHFWSRANQLKICTLDLDLDPARIEAAELHLVTWTGGAGTVREYFKLNGVHYPVADGARHDLVYSRLPVDPRNLKRGQNRIELLSDTEHHGIEVIYPGPALVVRCRRANSGLTPSGARAFLEDGRLVRVPSWAGSSAGPWARLARRSEAAFSGAATRPPPRRPG